MRTALPIPLATAAAGLLTLAVGCAKKEEPATAPVVRPVKVVTAGGGAGGTFRFPGLVDAGEKSLLSFRVGGRLMELPIEEGQAVTRGQLIGRLDPEDFQIAVNQAKAEFTRTEADYQRYQRLFENDAVPLADLDLRRSQRDVAKARLDEAERNLGYTYLRAPFAGRIGQRYVENFMVVSPNDPIADLNDVENVEIAIDVAENLVKRLRRVQTTSAATFSAAPGVQFPLTLKEAANRADPATQTFRVKFLMPQPDEFALLPGMTAIVIVQVQAEAGVEDDVVVIPAIAVVGNESGEPFVWVVDESTMTVARRPVTVGPLSGSEDINVLDGLSGGEKVVVAGLTALFDGMKVSIWRPE